MVAGQPGKLRHRSLRSLAAEDADAAAVAAVVDEAEVAAMELGAQLLAL